MKKSICCLALILFVGNFISCDSNDYDTLFVGESFDIESINLLSDEIFLLETEADILKLIEGDLRQYNYESINWCLKGSSELLQQKGFDTYRSQGSYKTVFSADLANRLGLSTGVIYVAETRRYIKNIRVVGTFIPPRNIANVGNSSQCGILPQAGNYGDFGISNWNLRGWVEGVVNPPVYPLETCLFYVNCDMNGRKLDKYYPKRPENLLWDYYDL